MAVDFLSGIEEDKKESAQAKALEQGMGSKVAGPSPEKSLPEKSTKKKSGWLGLIFKKKSRKRAKSPDKGLPQDILAKAALPKEGELKKQKELKAQEPVKEPLKQLFKRAGKQGISLPTPDSLEISLIPEKAAIIPRIIRSRFLLFFACLFVILTAFVVVWLYSNWYFEQTRIEVQRIEREMQFSQAQSASLLQMKDEIASLELKASRAESILNNHIYWTKFFSLLETYTIPEVYFGDFSANTSGSIHLEAVAEDLISMARQIVSFSQAPDFIKEVKVESVTKSPIGIKAFFGLVLVDNIFHK